MTVCSICGSTNVFEHTFVYYCLDCEEEDGYENPQEYEDIDDQDDE